MAFAKFEENRFRIDVEIAENYAILVNLTASIKAITILQNRSVSHFKTQIKRHQNYEYNAQETWETNSKYAK